MGFFIARAENEAIPPFVQMDNYFLAKMFLTS